MSKFGFEEMQNIQKELQEKYPQWGGLGPFKGRDTVLYMIMEAAEIGDILKKEGLDCVNEDPETRHHFIEEMCDVMMFFNDLALCYDITPEEIETVYLEKHRRNMKRWE